jgi:hypothetical protein
MYGPGAEYIVILNDRQLRDGQIRQLQHAALSKRPPRMRPARAMSKQIARVLAAAGGSLIRLTRRMRSAPA